MLIVYRGKHCPLCKTYLNTLDAMLDDFNAASIAVATVSADTAEKAKAEEEGSAVAAFVDFYLENLAEFVEGAGYVNLPDDQHEATTIAWDEKTAGTQEDG